MSLPRCSLARKFQSAPPPHSLCDPFTNRKTFCTEVIAFHDYFSILQVQVTRKLDMGETIQVWWMTEKCPELQEPETEEFIPLERVGTLSYFYSWSVSFLECDGETVPFIHKRMEWGFFSLLESYVLGRVFHRKKVCTLFHSVMKPNWRLQRIPITLFRLSSFAFSSHNADSKTPFCVLECKDLRLPTILLLRDFLAQWSPSGWILVWKIFSKCCLSIAGSRAFQGMAFPSFCWFLQSTVLQK